MQIEERVERHERSVQRVKGFTAAVGALVTLAHLAIDFSAAVTVVLRLLNGIYLTFRDMTGRAHGQWVEKQIPPLRFAPVGMTTGMCRGE